MVAGGELMVMGLMQYGHGTTERNTLEPGAPTPEAKSQMRDVGNQMSERNPSGVSARTYMYKYICNVHGNIRNSRTSHCGKRKRDQVRSENIQY